MKPGCEITGVWVRTAGQGRERRVEVLVELEGRFRLIQTHPEWAITSGEISHITEPAGMQRATLDPLDRPRRQRKR